MEIPLLIAGFIGLGVSVGCGRSADSYYQQALASSKKGDFDRAIRSLEKAAESDQAPAQIYYGLGVLHAYKGRLDESRTAFNKAVQLDSDLQIISDANTISLLKQMELDSNSRITTDVAANNRKIFTQNEVMSASFGAKGIKYISDCINYKLICDRIIEGCTTDEAKVFALFDWTYRNISIVKPRQIFHALPLDIMLRGYGVCDRSAWVFTTLADQAGFRGDIFSLRDPQTMESPHTVALIFLQNKWVVFDTYNGIVFRKPDNTLAGIDDIVAEPSLTYTYDWYKEIGGRCFARGEIQVPFEAEAGLPRMRLAQQAVDGFLPNPPKIYHSVFDELCFTLKTLVNYTPQPGALFALPFKTDKYSVSYWFFPFWMRIYYIQGEFDKNVREYDPALESYRPARLAFLIGNYHEAITQYNALLKTAPSKDYADDIEYFKALCYFEAKEYRPCIQALAKYLNEYPKGEWKIGAIYHLARSYEALGQYEQARTEYSKIATLPDALERIKNIKAKINSLR